MEKNKAKCTIYIYIDMYIDTYVCMRDIVGLWLRLYYYEQQYQQLLDFVVATRTELKDIEQLQMVADGLFITCNI